MKEKYIITLDKEKISFELYGKNYNDIKDLLEVVYVGMNGPSETETFVTSNRQINLNTRSTMLQIPLKDGIVAISYKISIYTKDGHELYTNSEAIFDMNGNRIQKTI